MNSNVNLAEMLPTRAPGGVDRFEGVRNTAVQGDSPDRRRLETVEK